MAVLDRDQLLDARAAADFLGLKAPTVYQWAGAGRLPNFKVGGAVRFRRSELEEWLESNRRGPAVAAS